MTTDEKRALAAEIRAYATTARASYAYVPVQTLREWVEVLEAEATIEEMRAAGVTLPRVGNTQG